MSTQDQVPGAAASWIGRRVFFRIRDAFLPRPEELLAVLCGATILEGDVVAESPAGGDAGPAATQIRLVVSVGGLSQLVVVDRASLFQQAPGHGEAVDKE